MSGIVTEYLISFNPLNNPCYFVEENTEARKWTPLALRFICPFRHILLSFKKTEKNQEDADAQLG